MEKKTIVRNIAIGAAVGAAVTMLKKDNREKLAGNVRKAQSKVTEMRESSSVLKDRVKERVQNVSTKGREMADLTAVKEKMEEIKKLTPAVLETIKETRDIFNKKKQELLEQEEPELAADAPELSVPDIPAEATEEEQELSVPVAVESAVQETEAGVEEEKEEEQKQTV